MFTNNNYDRNLGLGAPLPPRPNASGIWSPQCELVIFFYYRPPNYIRTMGFWGRSHPNTILFLFWSTFFFAPTLLVTRSKWVSEDSKIKKFLKKCIHTFFFLESSETYSDPTLNEIGATLNNFIHIFCPKKKINLTFC